MARIKTRLVRQILNPHKDISKYSLPVRNIIKRNSVRTGIDFRKIRFDAFVITCILGVVTSCSDPGMVYHHTFQLNETGWDREAELSDLWIADQDLTQPSLVLQVNFSPEFGYQNLYMTADISKNSTPVFSDTFSIQLANSRAGGWLGVQRNDQISVLDTIPLGTTWMQGDEIEIQLGQFSREELLKGIHEIEVSILNP